MEWTQGLHIGRLRPHGVKPPLALAPITRGAAHSPLQAATLSPLSPGYDVVTRTSLKIERYNGRSHVGTLKLKREKAFIRMPRNQSKLTPKEELENTINKCKFYEILIFILTLELN